MKLKSLASASLVAAGVFLAACDDRGDAVKEEFGEDVNVSDICYSPNPKNEELHQDGEAKERYEESASRIETTSIGQTFLDQVFEEETAFCYGDAKGYSRIYLDKKANTYLIDRSFSDASVAAYFTNVQLGKAFRETVYWTADYDPDSAVLWARAREAHKTVIKTDVLFQAAGQSFNSPFWRDVTRDESLRPYAEAFEKAYTDRETEFDRNAARLAVFQTWFEKADVDKTDISFLTWYRTELNDRTEPEASMCYNFSDGGFEPCITFKTVGPPKSINSKSIAPYAIRDLSQALYGDNPYIDMATAENIVASSYYTELHSDTARIKMSNIDTRIRECCATSERTEEGGTFGIGMSGGFGISLF